MATPSTWHVVTENEQVGLPGNVIGVKARTDAMAVAGGYLYRTMVMSASGAQVTGVAVATTFVPNKA